MLQVELVGIEVMLADDIESEPRTLLPESMVWTDETVEDGTEDGHSLRYSDSTSMLEVTGLTGRDR